MSGEFLGSAIHATFACWSDWRMIPRSEPWCWNIYLHNLVIFGVNVPKYPSTMEHLG
jgi:hypothetical protein